MLLDRRLCLAPMMGYTDQHCRALFHLICPQLMVYSEMLTTAALLHGDQDRLLRHSSLDAPCALQLGGSNPVELAACAQMAEDKGYQEININIGCPSDRVQQGSMGACLMAEPQLVAEGVEAIRRAVRLPVSIKCRIGIDDEDSYGFFEAFIDKVSDHCDVFIVHARKAVLTGLSPRDNREIPPLRHDYVYRLKRDHPDLSIILNGGLNTPVDIEEAGRSLDGVMIGRAALKKPMLISAMALQCFTESPADPKEVFLNYMDYADEQVTLGEAPARLVKHLLNLFHGYPGARHYRRFLSRMMQDPASSIKNMAQAINLISDQERERC